MEAIKFMVAGLLICLICLYLMNGIWGGFGMIIGVYGFPVGVIITIIGLFSKENN